MLELGYVKLHRKMLHWEWYRDKNVKTLFIHLLLSANYQAQSWQGVEIQRGERVTSLRQLAAETGLSVMQVRLALDKLKGTGEVDCVTNNKHSRIRLTGYEKYQSLGAGAAEEQQPDNKQTTTKKESKKARKQEEREGVNPGEVIEYLNGQTGKGFTLTEGYRRMIRAREREGASLEDFQRVILVKVQEWGGAPRQGQKDMRVYLRPSTLFGTKFQEYLHQNPKEKPPKTGSNRNEL